MISSTFRLSVIFYIPRVYQCKNVSFSFCLSLWFVFVAFRYPRACLVMTRDISQFQNRTLRYFVFVPHALLERFLGHLATERTSHQPTFHHKLMLSSYDIRELKHARFWDADANRKGAFCVQDSGVSQIFTLIISYGEKILGDVNVVVWRQVKRENNSLPVKTLWETQPSWHAKYYLRVAVRVSKRRVLKLPNVTLEERKILCGDITGSDTSIGVKWLMLSHSGPERNSGFYTMRSFTFN